MMNEFYKHIMGGLKNILLAIVMAVASAALVPLLAGADGAGAPVGKPVALPLSRAITDAVDGTPLVGANVLIKSTTTGTITDVDGKFTLDAKPEDVLVVSFIGYVTVEIPVGNRSQIDVSLEPSATSLNEIVVVG